MPKLIAIPLGILLLIISGLAIANAVAHPSPLNIFLAYMISIHGILLMTYAKRLVDNKYTQTDYIWRYFFMPWLLLPDHLKHRYLVLDVLQNSSLTGKDRAHLEACLYFKTPNELKALLLKYKATNESQ